ncbi:MAG: N-acetyltransferase [Oscillospiraceae bacterium]|nr:N-acetyltransferase [Oscillospiraceae bacterium]
MNSPTIRPERPEDYNAILRLTYEAFLTLDYPGRRRIDEHYLVHLLRDTEFPLKELCFVAESAGEIVGHILYTRGVVGDKPVVSFGPLSVPPKHQKQGIGKALVFHSMEKARAMGYGAVLITGVPAYYPKLGFLRGRAFGVTLPDGTAPDFLMGYELIPGYLSGGGVLRFEAEEAFARAEEDDEGFCAFHQSFMRVYYP